MGQIEIIKRDGTRILAYSKEPFCTPTQAVQNTTLMADDTVTLSLTTTECYNFSKGDRIVVNGCEYKIRTTVQRGLQSDRMFKYEIVFYGPMYDLMKCQYRNTDAQGHSTKAVFDLTYTLREFVQVIIYNMNRDYPGLWLFDSENCPDTEPLTLSFSRQNCLQVLQTLCKDNCFKTEFKITQSDGVNTIHIGSFGSRVVPPSGAEYFEWGKGNGLFTLTEKKVDDRAIITRLWVEGGTTNVRSGYRDYSDRIQLPYPKRLNRNRHVLRDGSVVEPGTELIGIDDDTKRYFEDADLRDAIGSEEDSKTYDECYPRRTGRVTALGSDVFEFIDDTMDFDLNAKDGEGNTLYLIAGTSAKITFLTGLLAGTEFELSKYDNSAKKFRIIKYTDERGLTVPTEDSNAFRIAVGDTYKLTDIMFPETYEQNAEEDLWYEGIQDFQDAKQARVQYELKLERGYFLDNMPSDSDTVLFQVGDYVPVRDPRFGIEKLIRITKVSRNLLLRHDYTLTLSDTTAIPIAAQTVLAVYEHERIIEANRLRDLTRAKRGWRTTEELRNMVYDTDGFFDTDNIRPNSIDTNMLTVGSKSQQFVLTGVVLAANNGGNPNQFVATAGALHHLTLSDDTVVSWNMAAAEVTLEQSGGYYVFAKCPKNGTAGTWYVTQEQLKVENASDPNNYYFQVGIIGSLAEGGTFRDFVTTYGFTRINGNTITTGKIVTQDGYSYLDLDGNKFRIGDASSSVDYNVTAQKKITLRNVEVAQGSGTPVPLGAYRGTYNSSVVYYKNDEVSYTANGETCTYRYINPTPGSGHVPTDSNYWGVVAQGKQGQQGQQGPQGDQGVPGRDGATLYTWIKYADDAQGTNMSDSPIGDGGVLKTYIGLAYNKTTATESTNPQDYTWALFKGTDGQQGVPGPAGADGTTYYTWIKYADSVGQGGYPSTMYDTPTANTQYIGIAVNQTSATEGTDPHSYTWSKFKGDQGVPGNPGSDGKTSYFHVKYSEVANPTTSAQMTETPSTYIGTYVDFTAADSTDPTKYTWSRFKGMQGETGEQGIPGVNGEDGRTSYLHIKYSDNGGMSFTDNNGETPGAWMGQYHDFAETDSSNPADYTWSLIRGNAGEGGADAEAGAYYEYRYAKNGSKTTPPSLSQTTPEPPGWSTVQPSIGTLEYLWMTVAQKSNLSDRTIFWLPTTDGTVTDKAGSYNGTLSDGASVSTSGVDLSNNGQLRIPYDLPFGSSFTLFLELYTERNTLTWILNGKYGREFAERDLAVSANTWFKLALRFTEHSVAVFVNSTKMDSAALNSEIEGFSLFDTMLFGGTLKMKQIRCISGALADSDIAKVDAGTADALVTNWSTPVRITPYDGKDGASVAAIFRGNYDSSKTYYGTQYRVDIVKLNGTYYVAAVDAGTFSGISPAASGQTKWNTFGAQFDSIATGLLLAEYANIGNLVIKNNCIISQKGKLNGVDSTDYQNADFVPNLFLDGENGMTVLQGSIRTGFAELDATYYFDDEPTITNQDRYDNLYCPYGSYSIGSFPWDVKNIGRRLTIVHNGGNTTPVNYSSNVISAPTGKYFFEDGIKKTKLKFCNEIVQLLGYGVGSTFLGWIVLSRENIMTVYRYGHHQRVMVHLRLTGSSSSPSLSKLACFDDSTFDNTKVSRIGAGVYRITLPSSWFSSNDQIMVMAVSETAGVVAAVTARNTGYVDITIKGNVSHAIYDGEGALDYYNTYLDSVDSGTVYIQIMNKSDWMLI